MMIEVINSSDIAPCTLPLSPAIKAGDFVFVSGQASVDEAGQIVADTFEGEVRRTFDNIAKILAAANLTFQDVVQVRAYVRDPKDLAEYNQIYGDYFEAAFPARTTLTSCLPDIIQFEMDVTAFCGKKS